MRRLVPIPLLFAVASCITIVQGIAVDRHSPTHLPATVSTAAKVHLADGSVLVLPNGFRAFDGMILGVGTRYDVQMRASAFADSVQVDSVIAVESFTQTTDVGASVFLSTLGTVVVAAAAPLLFVAVFGSCPTFYAERTEGPVLQAEGFSYSIAPLFEARDLDRIDVSTGPSGEAMLELRNEALETHYINEIKLLAVRHGPGEISYPVGGGNLVTVTDERPPVSATSRLTARLAPLLAQADESWYETPDRLLASVDSTDLTDHLDLSWPAPRTGEAALVFRMRNSLLTTILLYDYMLADQGATAIDWLAKDLADPRAAQELGEFFRRHTGVRVSVRSGSEYRYVSRLPDVGPIAWEEVALELPVPESDSVRVRLEFVADGWRFDRIALATVVDVETHDEIPVRFVTTASGDTVHTAVDQLASSDEAYLVTGPGTRYYLSFDEPVTPSTSYALFTQGYYTEWIRGSWIRDNPQPRKLTLSEGLLSDVIHDWARQRSSFERRFFDTRLPVR